MSNSVKSKSIANCIQLPYQPQAIHSESSLEERLNGKFQVEKGQISSISEHQWGAGPQNPINQIAVLDVAIIAFWEIGP